MKKTKLIAASLLALSTLISAYPATVTAAPSIEEVNGRPAAFVSNFGRVSYDGKAHQAYKTMSEALSALPESGQIFFQGSNTVSASEIAAKTSLELYGLGTKASGNKVTIKENILELSGDTVFSNLCIEMPENSLIVTGGNNFTATDGFDSFSREIYNAGKANTIVYPAPVSVSAGEYTKDSKIDLLSGKYKDIFTGAGEGTLSLTLSSVTADSLVIGGHNGENDIKGNVIIDITDSDIALFTSNGGKIDGNLIVNIDTHSKISELNLKGIDVAGSSVVITPADCSIDYSKSFDSHIKLQSGKLSPVFESGAFKGFELSDTNNLGSSKAAVDGKEMSFDNGIFTVAEGTHTVAVVPSINVALRAEGTFVAGYENGTFLPQNNMTRAEAITLLSRLIADETEVKKLSGASYNDVAKGAWYAPYIGLFEKLGFLEKLEENGNILPDAKITRGEFCELLYKIYPKISPKLFGAKEFSDVSAKHKFHDAVGFAGFMGIVGGYEDGTFRPDNNITRAEVVTMVNRMIGRVPAENNITVFSDTEGHWAKAQINAAANPATKDGTVMWTTKGTNKFDEYMQYRGSLSNTAYKLEHDKKLNIAFIGGSITAGSGASSMNTLSWRGRTMQYFKEAYPDCEIYEANAAIGDSYTKYAVYRMDNDLLKYNFDLCFIEYAINDSPWYSAKNDTETIVYFETLVRRIYEHNPNAEIVIVYTIDDKIDRTPKYFPTAAVQEYIAKHYDIPSVNFGRALADHIAEGGYKWGDYFADYVHPNDDGHLYYGAVISEYLTNALEASKGAESLCAKVLPEKHTKKELWYDLTMLEANEIDLSLSKNWALSDDGKKIYPTDKDNELVIKTYGSDICIASPRDDLMYYSVDGGPEQYMKMNRKPQTLFENLSDGEHTLRIRAEDITKLSIQRVMYNGKSPDHEARKAKSAGNVFILGDSYSTFEGVMPAGHAVWYTKTPNPSNTDVSKLYETWWHKFLTQTGSNLALNSSWSGSTICNTGYNGNDSTGSSFITRVDKLAAEGFFSINDIDTFLIFGATNDHWAGSPLGQMKYSDWTEEDLKAFRPALCYLLSRVKEEAGDARVIYMINTGFSDEIKNSIIEACNHYGVETLMLDNISKTAGHPNIAGMNSINEQLQAHLAK